MRRLELTSCACYRLSLPFARCPLIASAWNAAWNDSSRASHCSPPAFSRRLHQSSSSLNLAIHRSLSRLRFPPSVFSLGTSLARARSHDCRLLTVASSAVLALVYYASIASRSSQRNHVLRLRFPHRKFHRSASDARHAKVRLCRRRQLVHPLSRSLRATIQGHDAVHRPSSLPRGRGLLLQHPSLRVLAPSTRPLSSAKAVSRPGSRRAEPWAVKETSFETRQHRKQAHPRRYSFAHVSNQNERHRRTFLSLARYGRHWRVSGRPRSAGRKDQQRLPRKLHDLWTAARNRSNRSNVSAPVLRWPGHGVVPDRRSAGDGLSVMESLRFGQQPSSESVRILYATAEKSDSSACSCRYDPFPRPSLRTSSLLPQ